MIYVVLTVYLLGLACIVVPPAELSAVHNFYNFSMDFISNSSKRDMAIKSNIINCKKFSTRAM